MNTPPGNLKTSILDALVDEPQLELVILFGSLAQGNADWESDLDLAIDVGEPLASDRKQKIIAKLATLTGRPLDLIDLRVVGEPLLGEILAKGVRLSGSDEAYAALLRRHLFDAADFLPYRDRILEERRRKWIGS